MKGTQHQGRATRSRTAAGPAVSQHAPTRVLLQVGLVVCLAGCQLPRIGATPTPTATATEWQALHRRLHLPTVAPGTSCPPVTRR